MRIDTDHRMVFTCINDDNIYIPDLRNPPYIFRVDEEFTARDYFPEEEKNYKFRVVGLNIVVENHITSDMVFEVRMEKIDD